MMLNRCARLNSATKIMPLIRRSFSVTLESGNECMLALFLKQLYSILPLHWFKIQTCLFGQLSNNPNRPKVIYRINLISFIYLEFWTRCYLSWPKILEILTHAPMRSAGQQKKPARMLVNRSLIWSMLTLEKSYSQVAQQNQTICA